MSNVIGSIFTLALVAAFIWFLYEVVRNLRLRKIHSNLEKEIHQMEMEAKRESNRTNSQGW